MNNLEKSFLILIVLCSILSFATAQEAGSSVADNVEVTVIRGTNNTINQTVNSTNSSIHKFIVKIIEKLNVFDSKNNDSSISNLIGSYVQETSGENTQSNTASNPSTNSGGSWLWFGLTFLIGSLIGIGITIIIYRRGKEEEPEEPPQYEPM